MEILYRYALCLPLVLPPAICIVMMVFLPESPVLLKIKGKDDKMRQALIFYRGKNYDITHDEKDIEAYIKSSEGSFKENIKKKATINGFLMLLVMHVVQQLSGINAIMFYASFIFEEGNFFNLSSNVCVVILGGFQIIAVGIAAGVVDRLGRRLLWLISLGIMTICLIITGIYFIIGSYDTETASKIQFILVICICLYVLGFCLGTGPLPWAMIGEMLSAAAKSYTAPIVAAVNWLLGYLVTVSYPYLKESIGDGPVFLGYALVCILGFLYVLFVLIETKDKTLDEIQIALGSKKPDA
ncbi:sugar transporter [Holotrichia oblita]|uniref:Sugar transporter n=1 Tax=Holotrichia oblita TaxID=644536 RepID=A0ACB9TLH5_HOLOL|nr:sugar transporter [Holotrichia oblita]